LKRKHIKGCPKRLKLVFDQRDGPAWRPLPPFFMAGGLTISDDFADILQQFVLPPSQIRPVTLSAPNRADQGRSYFSLQIKLHEPTYRVLPERSAGLSAPSPGVPFGHVVQLMKPGDLVLDKTRLGSVDLWRDPSVAAVYFASGALSAALIDAGMKDDLRLLPCSWG
jgi:hypothetical protein